MKIFIYTTFIFMLFFGNVSAQLPECHKIYYVTMGQEHIYGYDPALPVSGTNPAINSIVPPENVGAIAVSEVLGTGPGSGTGIPTFYVIAGPGGGTYHYYNPATGSWVNTGYSAIGQNIGAGGGYLFSVGNYGVIRRFDGLSPETIIATVPAAGAGISPMDIVADCNGNFYILNAHQINRYFAKYNSDGMLLQTWDVTIPLTYAPAGGIAGIGNDIYVDDHTSGGIAKGILGTTAITFNDLSMPVTSLLDHILDMGSCSDNLLSLPVISISTPQTNLCTGTSVTFTSSVMNGGDSLQYQWYVNGIAITGANAATFTYTPENGDMISATLLTDGACSDGLFANSPAISLSVTEPYYGSFAQTICQGSGFAWADSVYTISGNYVHNFRDGCDSVVTLDLTVLPIKDTTFHAIICEGDSFIFNSQTYRTTGIYDFPYTGVNGCDSNVQLILEVLPHDVNEQHISICTGASFSFNGTVYDSAGSYTQIFQNTQGCDSTVIIHLSIKPTPETHAYFLVKDGQQFTFLGNDYTSPGTYAIHLHNGPCDSLIFLHLIPDCATSQPDAFTPNGDGKNDFFRPVLRDFQQVVSFRIFNRWGQLVFTTTDGQAGWDGSFKGVPQSTDVYIYYLSYRCGGEESLYEQKGTVTLIR